MAACTALLACGDKPCMCYIGGHSKGLLVAQMPNLTKLHTYIRIDCGVCELKKKLILIPW